VGKKSKDISIINKDLTIIGTVSSQGRLIINGTVEGTLVGENVEIGKSGVVYADAQVGRMMISGTFDGDVNVSEELVICASGKCSGKVVCKNLVVEAGGKLNADVRCVKLSSQTSQKEPPADRQKDDAIDRHHRSHVKTG
jgi:cytoskeletal protein CcmA (bactofilin family)